MIKKCELLVPVGGKAQLIAAVENGADAVYLGGKLFNARAKADNFDDEMMREGVAFAHKRGVKVYVTMNTLLDDNQIKRAVDYCRFLADVGVDAVIVQDLGLGYQLRKVLPDLELHLSTQGTIYGLEGVRLAESLGYSRVVTARELKLEEIRHIIEHCKAEIEVFVHGALCFSYSGQCQLSRAFGGRSGNKGACAQPCRLAYRVEAYDSGCEAKEGGTDKACGLKVSPSCDQYPLSPKDLNLIEDIKALVDAGVSSLKIEGRMKSPEYVAAVTKAYRTYLDEALEGREFAVSKDDKNTLMQVFNREGFTKGYLFGNPNADLMAGKISKHQGIVIGEVIEVNSRRPLCTIKAYGDFYPEKDDVVEFYGNDYSEKRNSAHLTFIENRGKFKGYSIFQIGDIKGGVRIGDKVHRIISSSLNREARKSFEHIDFRDGKFQRKLPLRLELEFDRMEGLIRLKGFLDLFNLCINIEEVIDHIEEFFFAEAGKLEKIKTNLCKLGGTPFSCNQVMITGEIPSSIPLSMINSMRRNLVEELELEIESGNHSMDGYRTWISETSFDTLKKIDDFSDFKNELDEINQVYFYSIDDFDRWDKKSHGWWALVPMAQLCKMKPLELESFMDKALDKGFSKVVPYISHVTKGIEDDILKNNLFVVDGIAEKYGVFIGNYQWLDHFLNRDFKVYGDFGLNISNSYGEQVMAGLGLNGWIMSSEYFNDDNGAYPLMITEHKVEGEALIDRKGQKLQLVNRDYSSQMIIKKKGTPWEKVKGKVHRYFY